MKVYCNMTTGETCVYPDVHASKMPNIPWRKSGQGWYSKLRGGFKVRRISFALDFKTSVSIGLIVHFQISYDSVGPVQMRFLRLLSEEANQIFTYTCINSVAWYDDKQRNYRKSIRFLGDNQDTFSATKNKPTVTHDGCKVRIQKRTTGFVLIRGLEIRKKFSLHIS